MINTKKLLKPIDKKKELKHIIFKCRAKRLIAAVSTERKSLATEDSKASK